MFPNADLDALKGCQATGVREAVGYCPEVEAACRAEVAGPSVEADWSEATFEDECFGIFQEIVEGIEELENEPDLKPSVTERERLEFPRPASPRAPLAERPAWVWRPASAHDVPPELQR